MLDETMLDETKNAKHLNQRISLAY
jgi:hypothetical protein